MSIRLNPYFPVIRDLLDDAGDDLLIPWTGYAWRFNAVEYSQPEEVLSGSGALKSGGRWNARGTCPVVYGSTEEKVALAEAAATEAYYGLTVRKPRLFVCIRFQLSAVLDLTSVKVLRRLRLRLRDLKSEDWRKVHDAGNESLTQCIGRAAAGHGAEGILCRSARLRGGLNLAWFPKNRNRGSEAEICDASLLRKLHGRKTL